jgi:hypothetical protein
MTRKIFLPIVLLSVASSFAQTDAGKLTELDSIAIRGTRLPANSIIRLSGLKLHDKVNDLIVNTACHKITATGLVKKIDYGYDLYPDRPRVALTLTLVDEIPLLPAHIKPEKEETELWSLLQSFDPLFTKELPRTEKAISFYATNLERCLKTKGRDDEYAATSVIADNGGNASYILFEIRRYKPAPAGK